MVTNINNRLLGRKKIKPGAVNCDYVDELGSLRLSKKDMCGPNV